MIIDIFIIIFFIYEIYQGWRRGLLGIVLKLIVSIIAIIVAFFIAEQISIHLTDFFISETMINNLSNNLSESVMGEGQALPDVLQSIGLSSSLSNNLAGNLAEISFEVIVSIVSKLAEYFVLAVAFIIFSIVLRIIFVYLIQKFTNRFNKIPVIGLLNRIMGLLFGILMAGLMSWLVVLCLSRIAPFSSYVLEQVSKSVLYPVFLNNVIFIS